MGKSLPQGQDTKEREVAALRIARTAGGTGPPPATLMGLILALLWSGSLGQEPGFSLRVLQSVSVQQGLCVLIPCTFTYPAEYDTQNPQAQLRGYWYKVSDDLDKSPVASSDPYTWVSQEFKSRFQLVGNMANGNCSLQLNNARWVDQGSYYFRVERGSLRYSYRSPSHSEPQISMLRLAEKPKIQISPERELPGVLVAGEPVTVTCTAPGRCSRTPPQITWTGPYSNTARDISAQLENGTWVHRSKLSFTPSLVDDGKKLTCTVAYWYTTAWYPSTSRDISLHIVYPPKPPNITWTLTRNKHPEPGPVMWGADSDELVETQEGDSLTLLCEADSRPVANLSWVKANETLSPGQGGAGHLELLNLRGGDAGEYRCWAKNPYGLASRALHVHVQTLEINLQINISRANRSDPQLFPDFPTPVENISQLTALEGDSLRFVCSASSSYPTTLHWVRGGQAVKNTSLVEKNQLQLRLPNVMPEDGGLYGCQAQSEKRSAQGTFQLFIEYSPRPGTKQNSSCQHQGTNISCICSLRSHPLPHLQWQVDGKALTGNGSWGALQVSSWTQGDEAISTLNWTGSRDRGPRIFCLGSNPIGAYAALHIDLSPPQKGAEASARLLGLGVVCGLGVAVSCFLLGLCVIKLWSQKPAALRAETGQTDNGSQEGHTADDNDLVYSNIMNGTTPVAHQAKGIQDRGAATKEPEELHYASIAFSKVKHKEEQPPEEPATEYSEIRLK